MKKIMVFVVFVIVIFIAILIVKTLVYPFAKVTKITDTPAITTTPSEKSIKRLAGGIRIPTISNVNYKDTDFKPFDVFKKYLEQQYPNIYQTMDTLSVNTYGLVFHWRGKNAKANPILFLSHYDVVPVIGYDPESTSTDNIIFNIHDKPALPIDSIQTRWQYPPFSGTVANGYIYGRGTLDMKGMLFSIMEAADALISEGFQPEQDIWFAFGQDEEVSGREGAVKIAEYFKEKGLNFDAVYDEGGIIVAPRSVIESIDKPLALIGTGEKGFLTLKISVKGLGGHSSMPPSKSSLVYAAEIIEKLNTDQMSAEIIPPIEAFLNNIGGEMNFVSRMAIANQWLLSPLLIKSFSKSPPSNALIRTTTAISMAKGSDAPNVLTSTAEVTVNFRILPENTVEEVMAHVKKVCQGYDVNLEILSAREPSSISPIKTKGYLKAENIINQLYPQAIVTPYITIGGTDAYKYQLVSQNIYRFMPVLLNKYEQRTIHNEDEQISIENYGKMIWYFKELMKSYQES